MAANADLETKRLFDLNGLKAVVTGGGTGIGLMITQALVANGMTVYITGRREDVLQNAADKHSTSRGSITTCTCDVTKKDSILEFAKEIEEKEPDGIHLLVNNAGVNEEKTVKGQWDIDTTNASAISNAMLASTPQMWADTFEANVTALYFVTAAFLPLLQKGRNTKPGYSSSVVNISSVNGLLREHWGQFAYNSSKAAVLHLSKVQGLALAEAKIRVNTICPGVFPSEMTAEKGALDERNKTKLEKEASWPAGRTGDDRDMASTILYLAAPGNTFTNGQILYPDGGLLLTHAASI